MFYEAGLDVDSMLKLSTKVPLFLFELKPGFQIFSNLKFE